MSVLDKLTEGIVDRDVQKEGAALLDKWSNTGLLEGIGNDIARNNMARLLENQAAQLLRESSAMSAGDVEGFAAVAFPIVRRVFGGLIANDLVSVQPMSLPSGLIFFMDFTYTDDLTTRRLGNEAGDSIYGGNVVGQQLTGGVSLSGEAGEDSFYSLNNGYSSPTASVTAQAPVVALTIAGTALGSDDDLNKAVRWDPDLSGSAVVVTAVASTNLAQLNFKNLVALSASAVNTPSVTAGALTASVQVRRLTSIHTSSTGDTFRVGATNVLKLVFEGTGSTDSLADQATLIKQELDGGGGGAHTLDFSYPEADDFAAAAAIGAVVGTTTWGLENEARIPEIDIKVDSVSVTAVTKKLKAKWTPELGQDLNAYHNLDAEVELTSVLSEHIALEIDREILEDLVKGGTAGTLYWSRRPGKFVNRESGSAIGGTTANESLMGADFTGTVSEWYETLIETINDVSARIHRKTLRGGANFVVCSPEVANLMEFTAGFRASVTHDDDRGTAGAVKVGSLSKKFDVYVDPYFPRNVVLVGRRGSSFLESGYVYAPYVPLQVTPTIFGTEDFVPRKGVMTRYAKKMVRPDMYGLVIVEDLLG